MSHEYSNHSYRTFQERATVTAYLRSTGGVWVETPDYTNFSREQLTKNNEQVRDAVLAVTRANPDEVEAAFIGNQHFIDSSFDFYEGKKDKIAELGKIGRAFLVPMRSIRLDEDAERRKGRSNTYASESIPFFPLYDPNKFAVTSEIRMRAMYGLPPTVLDTYLKSDKSNERGALVLVPMYSDMERDLTLEQRMGAGAFILNEAAKFAHQTLKADYAGLGAILPHPTITNFGKVFRGIPGMENLTTTTGHGGTVYMIGKTTLKAINESSIESDNRIGVLGGAGSIGWSTVQVLREIMPDHKVQVYDKREGRLQGLVEGSRIKGVEILDSEAEVFERNNFIVSAITEQLDLNAPEYRNVDFSQKIVIDDSQPGAVDRGQIEELAKKAAGGKKAIGGKVLWVAGQDLSGNGFMTKDGYYSRNDTPYNYGDNSGLYGPTTEFACGLEAAVIAASGSKNKAVTEPVRYKHAMAIGELFDEYGVEVADFQSFGQPVDIE